MNLADFNTITLAGHLVKDGVVKTSKSGNFYIEIIVANNYARWNGEVGTNYFNCSVSGQPAVDLKDELKKGRRVVVIGRVWQGEVTYNDKKYRENKVVADKVEVGPMPTNPPMQAQKQVPSSASTQSGQQNIQFEQPSSTAASF